MYERQRFRSYSVKSSFCQVFCQRGYGACDKKCIVKEKDFKDIKISELLKQTPAWREFVRSRSKQESRQCASGKRFG